MGDISMDWSKTIKVKKPVKRTQRSINFNEDNLKALSYITEFINSSSISDTIEQIIETYIEHGEIIDLDGTVIRVKDIINKYNKAEERICDK